MRDTGPTPAAPRARPTADELRQESELIVITSGAIGDDGGALRRPGRAVSFGAGDGRAGRGRGGGVGGGGDVDDPRRLAYGALPDKGAQQRVRAVAEAQVDPRRAAYGLLPEKGAAAAIAATSATTASPTMTTTTAVAAAAATTATTTTTNATAMAPATTMATTSTSTLGSPALRGPGRVLKREQRRNLPSISTLKNGAIQCTGCRNSAFVAKVRSVDGRVRLLCQDCLAVEPASSMSMPMDSGTLLPAGGPQRAVEFFWRARKHVKAFLKFTVFVACSCLAPKLAAHISCNQ